MGKYRVGDAFWPSEFRLREKGCYRRIAAINPDGTYSLEWEDGHLSSVWSETSITNFLAAGEWELKPNKEHYIAKFKELYGKV